MQPGRLAIFPVVEPWTHGGSDRYPKRCGGAAGEVLHGQRDGNRPGSHERLFGPFDARAHGADPEPFDPEVAYPVVSAVDFEADDAPPEFGVRRQVEGCYGGAIAGEVHLDVLALVGRVVEYRERSVGVGSRGPYEADGVGAADDQLHRNGLARLIQGSV